MSDRFSRLIEVLQQTMSRYTRPDEYMRENQSSEDPDPWDTVPFEQPYRTGDVSDKKGELIRKNARKIRQKVLQSDVISTDDAVEPAMDTLSKVPQQSDHFYYHFVGPAAATAEDLEWRTAFRLDLKEALAFKSDDWKARASEFSIPDQRTYDMVPKAIAAYYRALEEYTDRNDCPVYVHPEELRASVGPQISRSAHRNAVDHVAKFPGVNPPEKDGPAWEAIEEEPSDTSDTTASESHAD